MTMMSINNTYFIYGLKYLQVKLIINKTIHLHQIKLKYHIKYTLDSGATCFCAINLVAMTPCVLCISYRTHLYYVFFKDLDILSIKCTNYSFPAWQALLPTACQLANDHALLKPFTITSAVDLAYFADIPKV